MNEYRTSGIDDNKMSFIKMIIRKVKRSFYKRAYCESLYLGQSLGKFYVRYTDGSKSIKMYFKTASNYAELFGGEVIDAF